MPKSEKQKLKTLYVAEYFLKNTDENHPTTIKDIIDYLETEHDILAERRSVLEIFLFYVMISVWILNAPHKAALIIAFFQETLNLTI